MFPLLLFGEIANATTTGRTSPFDALRTNHSIQNHIADQAQKETRQRRTNTSDLQGNPHQVKTKQGNQQATAKGQKQCGDSLGRQQHSPGTGSNHSRNHGDKRPDQGINRSAAIRQGRFGNQQRSFREQQAGTHFPLNGISRNTP